MADVPIDRIRCMVGYVSADTAKIVVVTFNDKPITATCSSGTPSVGSLTAQGTAHGGGLDHVCHTGLVTITGLSAGQQYTYSLTHEGETISGSFRTEPALGTAWKLIMSTCEGPWRKVGVHQWARMRSLIESDSAIVARAHIDDIWYFDTMKVQNYGFGAACPETGITQTGVPQTTAAEADYAVSYAAYFGMFPEWLAWSNNADRQWIMRNIAWWTMFGDHEFYGDARSHVQRAGDASVMGAQPVIDAFMEGAAGLWNSFFGNANPPALRAGEYYWGMDFGGATFATLDRVTHAQAYNACNAGDSGSRGAADSEWHISDVSVSGDWTAVSDGAVPTFPTNPSRTSLGHATDDTPPDYLGANQVSDLGTHFTGSSLPWKVLLTSLSVTAHNQPWYDWHPDEWLGYIQTIFSSDACNGTNGHYCHFLGDVHAPWVRTFEADGTVDGLGGSGLGSGEFWEFNAGSWGSLIGGYNKKSCQGAKLRGIVKSRKATGDRVDGGVVLATFSPDSMSVEVLDGVTLTKRHFGPYTLDASATDNVFTLDRPRIKTA